MKFKYQLVIFIVSLSVIAHSQQSFRFIESVPKEFEEKYIQQRHEYNPLNLGNYWQYASEWGFLSEYIVKDTIVNDKIYYKKYDHRYQIAGGKYAFYNWERNDTTKLSSYMLDWEDLDEDGFTDDELLLDSLEIPNYHEYLSYRHTWKEHFILNFPSPALIMDSSWVIIFDDTVMSRYVMYLNHFYEELVADKYGVILQQDEAAFSIIITGAIIDSVQYGTIVSVQNNDRMYQPGNTQLLQNYPNPFNSSTTIPYTVNYPAYITISVYDVQGRNIKTLVNDLKNPGIYTVQFNAEHLSTGLYYYQLKGGGEHRIKKMLYIK
jgi:hypothetical protein